MRVVDPAALDFGALVRAGDTVMWGQANAEPLPLTRALMAQRRALGGVRAFVGMSWYDTVAPAHADAVTFCSYCGAGVNRALARAGKLEIWPWHYSALARGLRSGATRADVLLLQLAPADAQGRYSLGIAHEYLVPALAHARVVVAEINDRAPWTYGECYLADADIDVAVRTSRALDEPPAIAITAVDRAVARNVASLVEDGATLQVGMGALPSAVLAELRDRRDLGIHSGQINDSVADLARAGVVTDARKPIDRGVTVAGALFGGRRVYEHVARNPAVQLRSAEYTHDAQVLASLDRFVAVNAAVEVDLTGQVNSEWAGGAYVGAVGGLVDFMRGAQRAEHGVPVIALPSRHGQASRIVAALGGPVTLARSDAGVFVTEHGIADLRGVPLSERVGRMIAIADPAFRDELAERARSSSKPS